MFCNALICRNELIDALEKADANPQVSCVVLTGGEKAFAAGADIKEMASKNFVGKRHFTSRHRVFLTVLPHASLHFV